MKIYKILFSFSFIILLGESCLKSGSDYESALIQSNRNAGTDTRLVEFALTATNQSNLNTIALAPVFTSDTTIGIPIVFSSKSPASTDIKVTIKVVDSILTNYNNDTTTEHDIYKQANPDFYTVADNWTAIIPKGSNVGYLKIRVNPKDYFLNDTSYALPLAIQSVDQRDIAISGNLKTAIAIIVTRNQYDRGPDAYKSYGWFYHPTVPRKIERYKTLQTVNVNTCKIEVGDLGGANYYANIRVNADNSLNIEAAPGAAGGPYTMFTSGLPTTKPGYTTQTSNTKYNPSKCNNTFDPITNTFYLRYGYVGATGWRVTEEVVKLQ